MIALLACASMPYDSTAGAPSSFADCDASVADDVPAFYRRYFACTDLSMEGESVVLATESLPPYDTYYYGEGHANYAEWDDRGGGYAPNPNVIASLAVRLSIPPNPEPKGLDLADLVDHEMGTSGEEYPAGAVGVGPDSVANYNATAAPGDNILDEQYSFDEWGAHPSPDGGYHHHGENDGALAALDYLGRDETVYGIMCDGTVILGCDELDGGEVSAADLDTQNGHAHDVVDVDGTVHFAGRYHVHTCSGLGNLGLFPEIQYHTVCDAAPTLP